MGIDYNSYFSKKVVFVKFIAIMLIVTLHALPPLRCGYELDRTMPFYYFVSTICEIGVPVFFFISALLFYKHCDSLNDIKGKIKSRIWTLLVPYLLWNALFVLIYFVLTRLEFTGRMMNMGSAVNSFRDVVIGVLDARFTPLWFIKILMFYSILSPLILPCLKHKPLFVAIFILSIAAAIFWGKQKYDGIFLWMPVYLSGCAVGYYKIKPHGTVVSIAAGLLLLITSIITAYLDTDTLIILRLISPISVWFLTDWLLEAYITERFKVREWMTCTFFIYCTHYFVLNVLEKLAFKTFGTGRIVMFLTFIVATSTTVIFLMWLSHKLSRFKVYKIMTGGGRR